MRNWHHVWSASALVFGFAVTARSQPAPPRNTTTATPVKGTTFHVAPAPPSAASSVPPGVIAAASPLPSPLPSTPNPTSAGLDQIDEPSLEPLALPPAPTMSFEAAIRQSIVRNASAQVANLEIQRFEAVARQTRASWLPTLTANGTYTRLDSDRTLQGRVIAAANQVSANVTLVVPLVAPQQWAASSRASDQIDLARASRADVARQVAIAVAKAYLLVVSQKRVLEVNRSARTTALAHYEYARTRFAGGLGNKVDVVRFAQELAVDDAVVEQARAAVIRAREALGALIGAETPVDVVEPALAEPPAAEAALAEAESQRTDVQVQRSRVHTTKHSASLNYTEYLPYLNAIVQPFYQNPPSLVQPQTGWQAQLVLSVPLYDGGARYGRADERAAVSEEAQANLDGVLRQARSEVRIAFSAVVSAEASLSAAQRGARLANQALELAMIAYRAGATSNLEATDAERRARDASIQVAVAEDALRQARLDLLAASGRFPSPNMK